MTVRDGATVVHGAYDYPFFLHQCRSRHPYLCRRRRQTPFGYWDGIVEQNIVNIFIPSKCNMKYSDDFIPCIFIMESKN